MAHLAQEVRWEDPERMEKREVLVQEGNQAVQVCQEGLGLRVKRVCKDVMVTRDSLDYQDDQVRSSCDQFQYPNIMKYKLLILGNLFKFFLIFKY